MSESGPTMFVRAAATWTADDGAPRAPHLDATRHATTRLGRMAAHAVSALSTLNELRRTRPRWIVASSTGPLEGWVAAMHSSGMLARPEAVVPDGVANELSRQVGGLEPWSTVAAGPATVAMALLEAASWLANGAEDVVVVATEAELPSALRPAIKFEPFAAALHFAADPGPSDLAMLAGPDAVRVAPSPPTGPHAGSPAYPALVLAQAVLGGRETMVQLEAIPDGPAPRPELWCAQIKRLDRGVG